MMENKKCLKPPTSIGNSWKFSPKKMGEFNPFPSRECRAEISRTAPSGLGRGSSLLHRHHHPLAAWSWLWRAPQDLLLSHAKPGVSDWDWGVLSSGKFNINQDNYMITTTHLHAIYHEVK